jgi:hypothetical protein
MRPMIQVRYCRKYRIYNATFVEANESELSQIVMQLHKQGLKVWSC